MKYIRRSIRLQLNLFIAIFVIIPAIGATVSSSALLDLAGKAENIEQKWLAGTRILGEVADQISELRNTELARTIESGQSSLAGIDAEADAHLRAIDSLQQQYRSIAGPVASPESLAFWSAMQAYRTDHDAWMKSGGHESRFERTSIVSGPFHARYLAADAAVDDLIESNAAGARRDALSVRDVASRTVWMTACVSVVTVIFALWLAIRMRREVTKPLGAMTDALTRLAAGERGASMPELNREDEIGAMARAFEVFRANAYELEKAHESTRIAQEQAQLLARHDPLTGLANRRVFASELQSAMAQPANVAASSAVLVIDLDRFKPINDLHGHPAGDSVLCDIARRLKKVIRSSDTVARLGGDEFAIVARVEPDNHAEDAQLLATRVLDAIKEPVIVGDHTMGVGASIGIAFCFGNGTDADTVLTAADIAMYRAKRDGGGRYRFFEHGMDSELRAQIRLEAEFRDAVFAGEIQPHYQPLIDMKHDRLHGFEILARWHHPERGWVSPEVFIPLAERLGIISHLTTSVLRQACRAATEWSDTLRLSLNISPLQLNDVMLPEYLLDILRAEGFPPSRLDVEVTETAIAGDIDCAKSILGELHRAGVTVSLDDFGTGYSSLYHLRELKFDKVKIDKSFVKSMLDNAESRKLVDAILSLVHSLEMPAVAEGIEDPGVLDALIGNGCEYGQGYYFGKAMSATVAKAFANEASGALLRSKAVLVAP